MSGASKSERAYAVLRERILAGVYAPGHRLVLDRLARELDVSPVPVREAVRRLEAERLVEFGRNVGARVSGIDPVEYRHTMQTLAVVEGAATALSAPLLSRADRARAAAANEQLRRCVERGDLTRFAELNARFHHLLVGACPNPQLLELVDRGWARMDLVRRATFSVPARAPASVAEHDRILALVDGGAGAAEVESAVRAHRLATLAAFLAAEPAPTGSVPDQEVRP